MKKLIMTAVVLSVVTSVAVASSIAVPWFMDSDGQWTGFVTIVNNTDDDITFAVEYRESDGTLSTPTANTFDLAGQSALSFRPVEDFPGEGLGQGVPNKIVDAERDTKTGAAKIFWVGDATDIQGRYQQVWVQGAGAAAYLLPQGP